MASITKYASARAKSGYAWRVQYRGPDGKSHTKRGFTTKNAAQKWAEKNAVNAAEGIWIDPAHGKTTVGELGQKWLSMQTHLKPSSTRVMEIAWRKHVSPRWAAVPIAGIRPSDVTAWVTSIDGGAVTVRRAHNVLAQVLDMAVQDSMLAKNPARGVKLPRKPKAEPIFLTMGQLRRLAEECSRHGELVWLLGTVGLRWGEAAALRVRDVNFLRGRISVERNAVTVGSEVVVGTPKTHEKRVVAAPRFVLDLLTPLCDGKGPEGLLWASADGEPLRLPSKGSWYYEALGRLMDSPGGFPYVTPHGLRHVAAGLMVSSGANVKVVQRQLGHASAAMTLDTYADLFDGDLDEVAAAMDRSLAEVKIV